MKWAEKWQTYWENNLLLTNEPGHEGKLCHFCASLNLRVDLNANNISSIKKLKIWKKNRPIYMNCINHGVERSNVMLQHYIFVYVSNTWLWKTSFNPRCTSSPKSSHFTAGSSAWDCGNHSACFHACGKGS